MYYLKQYDLSGRVAVVTGAGRGIGLACSEALSEAGARVVIIDIDVTLVENAREYLESKGYAAAGYVVDVRDSDAVEACAQEILESDGRIDILVANAGVVTSRERSIDLTDEEWLRVVDVNLNGVFWCCRSFAKPMLEAKSGAIITMGSMSGVISNRPQIQPHYNASKAAVHHLTKSLAAEWAPLGVRINSIAPTYIKTPMSVGDQSDEQFERWKNFTPMARLGEPSEIAAAALFLASDASSLMTGAVLNVDGGYTCW